MTSEIYEGQGSKEPSQKEERGGKGTDSGVIWVECIKFWVLGFRIFADEIGEPEKETENVHES